MPNAPMEIPFHRKRGFKGFWSRVIINSGTGLPQYLKLANQAEEILDSYLKVQPYSKRRCFCFNLFIEEKIDYSKQMEYFEQGNILSSTLSAHIDYNTFKESDTQTQISLVLTSCQLLLEYWSNNCSHPSDFDIRNLSVNVYSYLLQNRWIVKNNSFFYKPTTNTNFQFHTLISYNVDLGQLCFDKDELEKYLTNELVDQNFGKGLRVLGFGLYIFAFREEASEYFQGSEMLISSSPKRRAIYIARPFDYNNLLSLEMTSQWDFFKKTFKENMSLINESKKRPKDYDFSQLMNFLNERIDSYRPKHWT